MVQPVADHAAHLRLGSEIGADPALDQRLGQLPDVDVGVQRPADALRHGHRLLQQDQLRLLLHLELLGHRQQLSQQPADRDLVQRQVEDRLADGPAGLLERRLVLVGGTKPALKNTAATRS